MLSLPPSCRVWLSTEAVDMRKGFDGLLAEARRRFAEDPLGGHLFVFVGRARDRVKVIWWDTGGLVLYCKRLEQGRFRLPRVEPGQTSVRLQAADLAMLLSGIDWSRVKRPRLYEPGRTNVREGIDKSTAR